MSKLIKIFAPIIAIAIAAVSVIVVVVKEDPTYEIDASGFNTTVAYEDEVDLSGIKIIEKLKEEVVKEITVDSSMVTAVDPTTSVGENKSLAISYAKNDFTLTFSVKYKIEFIVDEAIVSTQFVLDASEIVMPETPKKTGYEFLNWNPVVPQIVNDNMEITAEFTDVPTSIPNLGDLDAEYSDTLAKFTLPSNSQGKWEFVDDLSTPVGEIGRNEFKVQFIPSNSELTVLKDIIYINVAKKKLEFKDLVTTFTYDTQAHRPTFELDVEIPEENIVYTGEDGIDVDSYFYSYKIVDPHYEGSCMGTFKVVAAYITIDVKSPTEPIVFGSALPEIEYTVTGIDDPSILLIKPVYPNVNKPGEHPLTVEVTSEYKDSFNIVINSGKIMVVQAQLTVTDPEFATEAIYSNTLSSVEIINDNPNGYWEWVNPELKFTKTGEQEFNIRFVPYSSNYAVINKAIPLTVYKKQVEIKIIENEYEFDNTAHTIKYEVVGTDYEVQVSGNETQISAGKYSVTLQINDNNYTGTAGTTLIIKKKILDISFELDLDPVYVQTKLKDIELPNGYSWITPTTDLLTAGLDLEYDAKYTPEDTANYEIITGKIKIDVLKKASSIYGVEQSYSFDFDGSEKTIDGITTNPSNAELVYTYTVNGSQANRLYNAGTYTVTIEILENDFYLASKVTTTVVISQTKDSKPADTVYAIYGDTLGMFELPESSHGTWSWVEGNGASVGDAGTQTHNAKFVSTNINYSDDIVPITFIVEQREVKFINIQSTFTYDTKEKSASYEFDNGLDLNVIITNTKNEVDTGKRVNADTYQFTYTVNEANYKGSCVITLLINKAIPVTEADFANINPVVEWNTTLGDITLPQGYSFTDASNTVVSAMGNTTFKAKYTPVDTNNYEIVEGNIVVTAVEIAGSLDITNATENTIDYTYGDKYEITTSVNHTESIVEYKYYLNDVEVEGITDAGTYTVIVTLPASEHYLEASKEITIVVAQKVVDATWTNASEYIYSPNGQTPITAYYYDVNGTKVLLDLVEENNKEFKNVDVYSYTVTSNDSNYVISESTSNLSVEIQKATFDMSAVAWDYNESSNYIYNGGTYTVSLEGLPEGITAVYTDNTGVDAKTYNASVEFEYDTENYNPVEAIAGIEWKIQQANATVAWDPLESYVYNAKEYSYPTATINSVLRAVINLTVKLDSNEAFMNAGTYTFTATDESGNYNLSNSTIEITISPMSVEFDWEDKIYEYTGSVLPYPSVSFVDAEGNTINVTPTCAKEFKNVGSYTFTASYNDSNYTFDESTLTKTYEVEMASYDMNNIVWNYTSAFNYSGAEYEVKILSGLPEGVTVSEYKNNKATNKGSYTAEAVLEYDTENYNAIENPTITWEIKALTVNVKWDSQDSYVYGSGFSIPTASYTDVEGNVIALDITETSNKIFAEVGSYTFVASFKDEDNLDGNYVLDGSQITVKVTQASVGEASVITATYGQTLEDIKSKLPKSDYGKWSFNYDDLASVSVGTVGSRDFNVKFIATDSNYESFDSTVTVNVEKAKLTITVTNNTYTYNGEEKTIEYTVTGFVNNETAESAGVTVDGVISGINVNDSKQTTLTLSANNYYADKVNTSLEINKAASTITSKLGSYESDYCGSKFVIATSNFEVSSGASIKSIFISKNGVETDMINAGEYDVIVSALATDNYLAPDDLTFTFTINKIDPTLEYTGQKTFTYGDTINIVATTNDDNTGKITYTYYKLNAESNEYEEVSGIASAGTYKVLAVIAESTNYNSKELTISDIVVEQAVLDLKEFTTINATYGQTLADFEFTQPDNGTYTWVEDLTTLVGDAGADVTHKAKFTPNDLVNYEIEYKDVKFEITAATLTINIEDSKFKYNEKAQTVSYEVSGFKANDTLERVDVTVSSGQITATNVGSYAFTLSITGNTNYTGEVSGTLVIEAADPTITVPTFEAIYGDTFASIAAIENTGTEGSWTINEEASDTVGDAGNHTVSATFTPTDSNYNSKTVQTTLTVKQAEYTPTSLPTNLTATYGEKLASVELTSDDTTGSWSWVDTDESTTVGNAGEAEHYAVFTINDNYVPYKTLLTITVARAEAIITNNIKGNLVYNAEEQIDGLFTLNHNEVSLDYTITLDGVEVSLINAGTYKIVVSAAQSANYEATSLTVESLVIEQATPETIFESLSYEALWSTKLSDLADKLPQGYTFVYPNTVLDTVKDNQTFAAIYTPFGADAANYKTVNGEITVSVKRITGAIYASNHEFTYDINNTTGFTIEASTNNSDSNAELVYMVNGVNIKENPIINAGEYTVVISIAETDHYTAASKEITVVVNQAYEEIIVADEISYGATLSDVKSNTSEYGTIVITDTDPRAAVSLAALEEEFLGAVDEVITLYATFTPYADYAANFAAFTKEIYVTVVKKELTFTNVVNTYTYDATSKTITFDLEGFVDGKTTSDITVEGNVVATAVKDSVASVTLTINDTNYYGTLETYLTINKANPVDEDDFKAISITANWNTTLNDVVSQLPSGYTFTNQLTTSVGEIGDNSFDAIYTPSDLDNYNVVSGNIVVTVNKLDTTLRITQFNGLVYDPAKTYTVIGSVNHNEETTITVTITYNGEAVDVLSNAGTYKIVAEATEAKHYKSARIEAEVTITQATPTTDFTDVFTVKWTDSLTLADIKLDSGYTWYDSTVALDNIETDTYKAIYTPSDNVNYKSVEGYFTVTVNKADASVTSDAVYSIDYTGSAITLPNVTPSHNESTVIYTVNNETVSLINSGTYNVVIVLPESTHYNKATCNATVTINKINVEFEVESYDATYGDTLGSLGTLPTSDFGTWAWASGNDTLVGDAGTRSHNVVFTPSDDYKANYNTVTETVTVNVSQFVSEVTTNIPDTQTFNGTTYDYTKWFTLNHSYGTLMISVTLNGATANIYNAGTYKIVVSLAETTNYSKINEEYSFTINQATYTPTSIPTASAATYGDTLSTVDFIGGDSNGTWAWVSGTDLVGNAGTRTHNARFTPTDTNYAASTHAITVSVAKRTVTFTNVVNEYTYNGSAQNVAYLVGNLVGEDATPTINGNTAYTNAGSYSITLSVSSDNYQGSLTTTLTINKATPTLTIPAISTYEDRADNDITNHLGDNNKAYAVYPNTTTKVSGKFTYDAKVEYTAKTYADADVKTQTISVTVTFTPTDTANYNTIDDGKLSVTLSPVAYNSSSVYYGTVESALDETTSGTVNIIVGTNPVVRTDTSVLAGVTLFIPYSTSVSVKGSSGAEADYYVSTSGTLDAPDTSTDSSNYGTTDAGYFTNESRLKNTLTISEGKTLTNLGTIEISGQLSGGGGGSYAAGHTYGYYTRILLEDNAEIVSTGTINCYGYIDESSLNNGSKVTIESGSIYMPYVLRDFRGGSYMYAVYSKRDSMMSTPFNQYEFRNVNPTLIINYNGQLNGWANLYAGSQQNYTEVKYIGNTSSYFIMMNNATYSYVEYKYDVNTEVADIKLYGGAQTNSIKLSVKVIFTIDMDTTDYYFPLSWRLNLTLCKNASQTSNAIFSMPQTYKILPGGKITVEAGAELTVGELSIYESWTDTIVNLRPYGEGKTLSRGQLIVNGKVTANSLAGVVETNGSGAQLIINSKNSITTHESTGAVSGSSLSASIAFKDVTNYLKLYLYKNGTVDSSTTLASIGTYLSKDGGWYAEKTTIYYDANGGTLTGNVSEGPYTVGDGYAITAVNTTDPTREHYTFAGWHLDSACTQEAIGQTIFTSVTLYAKWTPITYSINFEDDYYEDFTNTDNTYATFTFNVESNSPLPTVVTNGPSDAPYVFSGWYLDEDHKLRIYNTSEIDLSIYLSGTTVTLYALWYENGTEKYTVTYVSENSEYTYNETTVQYVIVDNDWSTASMPQLTENNSDKTKTKYFAGWTIDGATVYNSLSEDIFTNTDGSITLEAVWNDKYKINVTVDQYDNGTKSSSITESIWYIPEENITISTSYLPSGYAYKATVNGSTEVTLGTAFSTVGFASEVTLTIELHNIITVTCTTDGHSDIGSYSFAISKYVDSNGKIMESTKTLSSTTGTIQTIYGATATITAKTSGGFCAIRIYKDNVEVKKISAYFSASSGTYTETVSADVEYKVGG